MRLFRRFRARVLCALALTCAAGACGAADDSSAPAEVAPADITARAVESDVSSPVTAVTTTMPPSTPVAAPPSTTAAREPVVAPAAGAESPPPIAAPVTAAPTPEPVAADGPDTTSPSTSPPAQPAPPTPRTAPAQTAPPQTAPAETVPPATSPPQTAPPAALPQSRPATSCQNLGVGPFNEWRAALGVAPLSASGSLYAGACDWATQMAATKRFAHAGGAWEVIAMNQSSCAAAFGQWRNSASHYQIAVNGELTVAAVACVADGSGSYWAVGRFDW